MLRRNFFACACLLFFTSLLIPLEAHAKALYGPKKYKVNRWHYHFSRNHFKAQGGDEGVITVFKAAQFKKIKWGFVYINGKFISLRKLVKSDDRLIKENIKLKRYNRMYVYLRGYRNGAIRVKIKQKVNLPPPKLSVALNPDSITPGGACVLSWKTKHAKKVFIDQGIGQITYKEVKTGSRVISPSETTTYTVTAKGRDGKKTTKKVTINVVYPIPAVTASALPDTIDAGGSTTLRWRAEHADSISISPEPNTAPAIDGDTGAAVSSNPDYPAEGSLNILPTATTVYTIVATGPGGQSEPVQVTVTVQESDPYIYTVAGNHSSGGYDPNDEANNAVAASLNNPAGIALDADGNLYIADQENNRIRKVDTNGIITTIAGNGVYGFNGDGPAAAVQLRYPSGIAVGTNGDIFFADKWNNRIRKIDSSGNITTIAGADAAGYDSIHEGVLATGATLNGPEGLALDASGNLYFCDQINNRIRKIDTAGHITTIAGNGSFGYDPSHENVLATGVSLGYPVGIFVSQNGNLYFSDHYNNRIRVINADGYISTFAGNGNSGTTYDPNEEGRLATDASLWFPTGVTGDSLGNIFIADYYHQRVRKVASDGVMTTFAGASDNPGYYGDSGLAVEAFLNYPMHLAVSADGRRLYIADTDNHRIRMVAPPSLAPAP